MANARPLYWKKEMLSPAVPLAWVTPGPCSLVQLERENWGCRVPKREKEADLANLILIYLSNLFLLTCVSSYSWLSQVFVFPYWKTELLPEQCDSGPIPSYSAQCNLGSLLVNIFCQQPARKHKIRADKFCRCCRVQGVVNNDQHRTLIWVFS